MASNREEFFIHSYLKRFVLDVNENCKKPGTKVIVWPAKDLKDALNQLWYQDMMTQTVRSCSTDLCLDIEGGRLCVNDFRDGDESQQWAVSGKFIVNMKTPKKVLSVVGEDNNPGAEVCCWECHGNKNQLWYIEYVGRN